MKKLGVAKGEVVVQPYNKRWIKDFEKEKKYLLKILDVESQHIEHIGSTAVPNLSAKPIIDISVGFGDEKSLYNAAKILVSKGYFLFEREGRTAVIRRDKKERGTHFIHLEILNSSIRNDRINFKNYLIKHPDAAKEYETLKTKLADQFAEDRTQYSSSKTDFIKKVLDRCKVEAEL